MNWPKTIQKTFVAAFFVVLLGDLLVFAVPGDGSVGQGPQVLPSLMPPRPGLIKELQREGKPLPPFITNPGFFKARGINQGPRRPVKPAEEVKRARPPLPLGPEGQWEEKPGRPAPDRTPRLALAPKLQPSGNFNAIALLVEFTDNSSSVASSFFDQLIFGSSGSSVRVYYQEVSYGTLTIVTVDLPSSTGWYTAPQAYAYYANGDYGFGAYPQNAQRLTEDAVYLADPYVDFSQYDNDSDGFVDALFVIHAGPGGEFTGNPNDIWSHQWSTHNPPLVDGVYVTTYSMEPEYWDTPGDMTIGVYCHELGHVFGLPDLYDYDYDAAGIGRWSLMAGGSWNGTWPGGDSPAHPDAWSRVQLGFVTPVTITTNTSGVVINSVEVTSTNSVYYVWNNGAANNEYFLVENRQQTGYDAYLPSNGLLIWHVDENTWSNNNQCTDYQNCNCALHYKVALEQADGNLDLEWYNNAGDAGDPYPGTTNNRTFNLDSTPNCGSYANCTSMVEVFNISNSGATMTADINVSVPYGVILLPASRYGYGTPGATVTYTEQVLNYGTNSDSYDLTVSGNTWPTTIWDATFSTQINNTGNIAPGGSITVGLRVDIPGGASAGDSDTATLQATSVASPTVSDTAVFTTSVPHPILLVDDDAGATTGSNVESYYQNALTANGYAYDYWDTDVQGSLDLAALQAHDIVIWFTGEDYWSSNPTITPADEAVLSAYLDSGGKLFVSSQDYLFDWGLTSFGQNYLHIGSYTDDVGHTQVTGTNVFAGYGPYTLSYPFWNYSDDVFNDGFSQEAFIGNATGNPTGLTYVGCFKTIFFAYPFEALQSVDANAVMDRTITWLDAASPAYYDMNLSPSTQAGAGAAGAVVTYTVQVYNLGTSSDSYDLAVSGNAWPATIWDASFSTQINNTGNIAPCAGSATIGIRVEIPGDAAFGDSDAATLTVASVASPAVSDTALLTTHTPPWEIETSMPTPRHRLAVATAADGRIYAVGGWLLTAPWGVTDILEIYDPVADGWGIGASRPISAANVAAAAVGSDIYVPGGYVWDSGIGVYTYTNAAHVYHTDSNTWDSIASLPIASCGQMVAAANGKVYVFGGSSAIGYLDTTYEYDPVGNTWTPKSPMPGGGRAYGAAVLNGKIYVVGGWPDVSTVEVYDPASDSWTTAASLNRGRQSPGLAALDGYVFAIGGGSMWAPMSSVERYDPASDTWSEAAPLNVGRAALGAAMTGGRIYAIGGYGGVGNENESYGPVEGGPAPPASDIYLPIILKNAP